MPPMRDFDAEAMAESVVLTIKSSLTPLALKLSSLESKLASIRDGRDGKDGKDIDPIFVKAMVAEAVSALPPAKDGKDGKDADSITIKALVVEAVAALPVPKDGAIGPIGQKGDKGDRGEPGVGEKGEQGPAGKDADPLQLKSLQDEVNRLREEVIVLKSSQVTLKDGKDGRDGRDIDMQALSALIDARVAAGVAAAVSQETQKAIASLSLPPAPEAVGIASAFIDHEGELVITMSDGSTKNVGIVKGRDGRNGEDGKDGIGRDGKDGASVDASVVKSMVVEAVAAIPKPKDGKDGIDGLSFTDAEFISRGPRGITVKLKRGDLEKSFDWDAAIPAYVGTFEVGKSYHAGDIVTRQGSMWFCHQPTSDLPGEGAKAWQLCVKRGSPGQKGEQGPKGVSVTRDLTQMDTEGRKW